jgi:outer membrane protein TolC
MPHTRSRLALAVALTLCGAGCANPFAITPSDFAQTPSPRIRSLPSLALTPAAEAPQTTPTLDRPPSPLEGRERDALDIARARAEAIRNNLDIRAALLDPAAADATVSEESARFDSVFRIDASYNETDTPTSSTLTDAQANQQFVQPTLTKPLLTGGSVDLSVPIVRSETNNTFSTLNPAYTSDFVARLTQPLLRNAGRVAATAPLRLAGIERDLAETRTRAAVSSVLAGIDRTYWLLWSARKQLDLRIEELGIARRVLEQARRLVEQGAAAEIEIIRAESGVADRVDAILQLEREVLARQRELKRAMNADGADLASETVIDPLTDPTAVPFDIDTDTLLDVALESRTELLELELRLLADATSIRLERNRALPQLDLTATYRSNGLGDDLDGSFDQLAETDFEDFSVGLAASIPIGNEAAEARVRRATLQRLSRIYSKRAREQTVRQEVFDAAERLRSDWQRILASRQSVALNARTLAAEQRQFEAGLATATQVLEAAGRLAAARADEIRSVADYQLAQVALAEATGTTIGQAGVVVGAGELDGITSRDAE